MCEIPVLCRCNGQSQFLHTVGEGEKENGLKKKKKSQDSLAQKVWRRRHTADRMEWTFFLDLITHPTESPYWSLMWLISEFPKVQQKKGGHFLFGLEMHQLRRIFCIESPMCLCSPEQISGQVEIAGAEIARILTKRSLIYHIQLWLTSVSEMPGTLLSGRVPLGLPSRSPHRVHPSYGTVRPAQSLPQPFWDPLCLLALVLSQLLFGSHSLDII